MKAKLSWLNMVLVLVCVALNIGLYVCAAVACFAIQGESLFFFGFGVAAVCAYCMLFKEAQLLWRSDRRVAALLQWFQFTLLSDAFELVVYGRTRGVVADIRNNSPVFGLETMIQLKITQGLHAATPLMYVAPLPRMPACLVLVAWLTGWVHACEQVPRGDVPCAQRHPV